MRDNDVLIITADTMGEALEKAQKALGLPKEKISIEMAEKRDQGLMGVKTHCVEFRVWPKEHNPEQIVNVNGQAGVKNGQLQIIPPQGQGQPPQVVPGPNMKLIVNGQYQEKTISLQGDENIQIELDSKKPLWEMNVEIAKNALAAFVNIKAEMGYAYKLNDGEPAFCFALTTASQEEQPQGIDMEKLQRMLANKGITFGVDYEALKKVVNCRENARIQIASGLHAVDPIDEYIEYERCFTNNKRNIQHDAQKIDFYEINYVPAVEEGDALAVKHQGIAGKPGRTVTGEIVQPRPIKQVHLKAGHGVLLIDGGNKVIAGVNGKPLVKKGLFKVLPVHVVKGDLNLQSGNIRFTGHVDIKGDVNDNLEVAARGNVLVKGIVSGAKLVAHEGIIVGKSVIASQLYAGKVSKQYSKVIPLLVSLCESLPSLDDATQLLRQRAQELSQEIQHEAKFARLLVAKKFATVETDCRELEKIIDREPRQEDVDCHVKVKEIVEHLRNIISGQSAQPITLESLIEKVEKTTYIFQENADHTADINTVYVQNSHLEASGFIHVSKACYNSSLTAGQGVIMEMGAFRGGQMVIHKGNAKLGELGSPNEAQTSVKVIKRGLIKAKIVHPNVRVNIGGDSYYFTQQARNVTLYLNKVRQIEVSYL